MTQHIYNKKSTYKRKDTMNRNDSWSRGHHLSQLKVDLHEKWLKGYCQGTVTVRTKANEVRKWTQKKEISSDTVPVNGPVVAILRKQKWICMKSYWKDTIIVRTKANKVHNWTQKKEGRAVIYVCIVYYGDPMTKCNVRKSNDEMWKGHKKLLRNEKSKKIAIDECVWEQLFHR